MFRSIQSCIFQSIFYKGFICQSLKGCTGFGNKYEDSMCHINRIQHCCRIIRIYITDKLCFHLEQIIFLCPVFKCQIHSTWTKITSADTDLYYSCKLLTCCICDFSCMYFMGELSNLLLLFHIKCTLVHSVCHNSISQLSAGQLMQYKTFLSCIDDFSIIKFFVLFCQLSFFCQFCKSCQNLIIHLFCCVVINKACCHRNAVIFYTLSTIFSGHHFRKINTLCFRKILKRSQGI